MTSKGIVTVVSTEAVACTECGEANGAGAKFCVYCGTELVLRPDVTVPAARRPCPWCAEPIRQAAVICRWCGNDATAPLPRSGGGPAAVRRDGSRPLFWVAAGVSAIAALAAVVAIFVPYFSSDFSDFSLADEVAAWPTVAAGAFLLAAAALLFALPKAGRFGVGVGAAGACALVAPVASRASLLVDVEVPRGAGFYLDVLATVAGVVAVVVGLVGDRPSRWWPAGKVVWPIGLVATVFVAGGSRHLYEFDWVAAVAITVVFLGAAVAVLQVGAASAVGFTAGWALAAIVGTIAAASSDWALEDPAAGWIFLGVSAALAVITLLMTVITDRAGMAPTKGDAT